MPTHAPCFLVALSNYNCQGEKVSTAKTSSLGRSFSNSILLATGCATWKFTKVFFFSFWGTKLMSNYDKMIAHFARRPDNACFDSKYFRGSTLDIEVIKWNAIILKQQRLGPSKLSQ